MGGDVDVVVRGGVIRVGIGFVRRVGGVMVEVGV